MKRKLIITGLLISMLAVMTVLGVSTYQSAKAATTSGTQAVDTSQETTPNQDRRRGFDERITDEFLAEALGKTVDEVSAARQAAWEAGLAQAVEQDLITQTQADELLSGDKTFSFGGRTTRWLTEKGIDFDALLAKELGISVDELQAAYAAARDARIEQAVADGFLTEEQASLMKAREALSNNQKFQDSMQSAYQTAIQQAVEDGVITQEQADLLLAQTFSFHLPGLPGDRGGRHGPHGPGEIPSDATSEQMETP